MNSKLVNQGTLDFSHELSQLPNLICSPTTTAKSRIENDSRENKTWAEFSSIGVAV